MSSVPMETESIKVKEEFKTEPRDIKNEPQDPMIVPPEDGITSSQEIKTLAIKLEPQNPSLTEQELKTGVIQVKAEPLGNIDVPKTAPQEFKQEYESDKNETHRVKSETSDDEGKSRSVKCEPHGNIAKQVASASGLVIESTSTLSADYTTGNKTSLNVNIVLGSPLLIKEEVLYTAVKEENIDTNLQKISSEAVKVETISIAPNFVHLVEARTSLSEKPRRTCKRIDYSVFGDSGSDDYEQRSFGHKKTKDKVLKQSTRQKAMCLNPKWKAKNEANTKDHTAEMVNNVQHVKNVVVKSEQPSCEEMKRPMEEKLPGRENEVLREPPIVWINIKKETVDEDTEHLTNTNIADIEEENQNDWQFTDINDGLDLVRNINEMLSKSIKTEIDVLETPTVIRGRRERRKVGADELANELFDGQALSMEQAELLTDLRSRMNFSDPATLSYWDGFKCHLCLICAYRTHVPANMVKHIRCHTGEKPYACAECDYRSAESSSMATHMRTHTGEKPYACPHCDYRTSGSSILKTHIMIHTGKKPFSCPHCDFKCREHGGLKRHIRTHTGEKPFACPHCEYRGPSSTCLKSHLMVHTKAKPHVCGFCGYATACSSSLTIHLRRHTGEKPYSCSVCSHKFVSSGTLKVHMRTHTGEKPYSCKICGYRSATQGRFKAHLRIHSGDKKHECPFCDYKSVRSDNLKIHLRTHTGERPYPCPYCEYRSSEKARLVQHIRVHTGEKPFVCSICGFKTADSTGLRSHSHVHSSEKPFCCSYCDFKTTRRGILKTHIMRHTGVKPYACPFCPYKCTKSCSLKGHVANNHTGNKKFLCDAKGCNYRAVFASMLRLHKRKHSKNKPFKCGLCSYRGKHEHYLKDHVKRSHSSDQAILRYSCYYCLFYTSSRQKMKSHAVNHLELLKDQHDCSHTSAHKMDS